MPIPGTIKNTLQVLKDIAYSPSLQVDGEKIVTAAGKVWDDHPGDAVRFIQNIGTTVVLVAVRGAGASQTDPTIDSHHFVLAAGDAANDGKGGSVDLSRFRGAVYVSSVSGSPRVNTFRAFEPKTSGF